MLLGFGASSELLHLIGLVLGLAIGVVMVKKEWVDCEGWDYFSIRRGDHKTAQLKHIRSRRNEAPEEEDPEIALELFRNTIEAGDAESALEAYMEFPGTVGEDDERDLLNLLFEARKLSDFRKLASRHVKRYPDSALIRLKLALVIVRKEQKKELGPKLLATIPVDLLRDEDRQLHATLVKEAQQRKSENAFEFADEEDW